MSYDLYGDEQLFDELSLAAALREPWVELPIDGYDFQDPTPSIEETLCAWASLNKSQLEQDCRRLAIARRLQYMLSPADVFALYEWAGMDPGLAIGVRYGPRR